MTDDPGADIEGRPSDAAGAGGPGRWLRRLVGVGAAAVFLGGVALVVAPGTVTAVVPLDRLREPLGGGSDGVWRTGQGVGAVAVVAGVLGALWGWRRAPDDWRGGATPSADRLRDISVPTAGADLDGWVDRLRTATGEGDDDETDLARRRVRDRLRETATTVLVREGHTAEEAAAALDAGSWTDDPRGAALFGPDPPLRVRVRDWLSPTSTTVRRVDHALAELEARVGGPTSTTQTSTADRRRHRPADDGPADTAVVGPPASLEAGVTSDGEATTATGDGAVTVTELTPGDDGAERHHARGFVAGVLAVGVGIVSALPSVVLLGTLGVAYGGLSLVTAAPAAPVQVTRTIGTARPAPGDVVEVAVTVENRGDGVVPWVTVVDGVPDALPVVEGSPATSTALRPGETTTFTYAVRARRGRFDFEPTAVSLRSLAGTDVVEGTVSVETPVDCHTVLDEFPPAERALRRVGVVQGDSGGDGIEFYATREYQPGDPTSRIDWNRLARTGEVTTVQFREQRGASVLLLVDARDGSRVAPRETALDAVDRSVYAAERVFLHLLDRGVSVGAASWSGGSLRSVSPSDAADQRPRVLTTLSEVARQYAVPETGVDGERRDRVHDADGLVDGLRRRLDAGTQVVLFSPVVDGVPVTIARQLRAAGRDVTVVSPSAVGTDTAGQRTLRVERAYRLRAIRATGAGVVDWAPNEAVQTAVARLERRRDR